MNGHAAISKTADTSRQKVWKARMMQSADLPTLIGDERLVVGWRLRFDLASLALRVTSVMAMYVARDPVTRTVLKELVKLGGNVHQEVVDSIMI